MDDSIPEGAIPVDSFKAAEETPMPEGSIPVDQFKAADPNSSQATQSNSVQATEQKPSTDSTTPVPYGMDQYDLASAKGPVGPQEEIDPVQAGLTAAEGAAEGAAGPLATGLELGASKAGVPGITAEDMKRREQQYPTIRGVAKAIGMAGSLLAGYGGAPMIAKAAGLIKGSEALGAAAAMSRVGATALKGAVEAGALQGGDEISKAMLGQPDGDPEAAVSAHLSNVGAAMLFGGVLGTGLGTGSEALRSAAGSKMAGKAAEWKADFGSSWRHEQAMTAAGGLSQALTDELTDFHNSTKEAADAVYGPTGLKAQAIEKLVPEMHQGIIDQNQEINQILGKSIEKMEASPEKYPHADLLQDATAEWRDAVTNPDASSADRFNATQKLKQQLQGWSKFEKRITPFSPEASFVNEAKTLQHNLKLKLEDPEVWGKAADLQKGVNEAFTEFNPALKDFESKFTSKELGEQKIDAGKVDTYTKQVEKPSGDRKKNVLDNFVDASDKYRSQIQDLHDKLGIENTIAPAPLTALKSTLKRNLPPGAKAAQFVYRKGLGQVTDPLLMKLAAVKAGGAVGGPLGAGMGYLSAHALAPTLEHVLGRPLRSSAEYGVSGVLKALGTDETDNLNQIMDYGQSVKKGSSKLQKGVDMLFKPGRQAGISEGVSDKTLKKLKDYIDNGGINQELQPNQSEQSAEPQGYAEGGEVSQETEYPYDQANVLETHFPEQNIMLNAAKSRISNYLTTLNPIQHPQKLPFDPDPDTSGDERIYDNALNIASEPLSILDKMKDGTMRAQDVKHFTSMYPELHQHLSKQITKRVLNAQKDDEKPNYVQRQAMSLFLGSPLDSTMTPMNIMAAQSAFIRPLAPPLQQGKTGGKKGTSTLGKSNSSYKTPNQAAEGDRASRE